MKQAVERALGLTFDQFRRSVLLAQGDFAAFLDADPKERADLLERMTGTEIYGVISMERDAASDASPACRAMSTATRCSASSVPSTYSAARVSSGCGSWSFI